MKRNFIFIFPLVFAFFLIFSIKTNAYVTFENAKYDVEINISKDSSYIVRETIVNRVYGEFHALTRDIPLDNPYRTICLNNTDLTCGGFDMIIPIAVYTLDGKKYPVSDYTVSEFTDKDSDLRYLRFEKLFFPQGKSLNGEEFGWTIEYQILGGIEWLKQNPYFYWNLLPPDRQGSQTDQSHIVVNLPEDVVARESQTAFFSSFTDGVVEYNQNSIVIDLVDFPSDTNFTMSYKFNEGDILKPSILSYIFIAPELGGSVSLDGVIIDEGYSGILNYIPSGNHIVTFSHNGYESYPQEIKFLPGEVVHKDVTLIPTAAMSILLMFNWVFFIFGIVMAPLLLCIGIWNYLKRGRDKDMPKTIIPLFSPPEGVRPYLLGTIKDETVDRVDVIGSIIDLAYRGFIKIKEIEKDKNYELIKVKEFEDPELEQTEIELLGSLFGSNDSVNTKDLGTSFALKYRQLEKGIYKEVVTKGYFSKEPSTVRVSYLSLGLILIILGLVTFFVSLTLLSNLIGYPVISTLSISVVLFGIFFVVSSKFMPSKTSLGSKVYAQILGFRMYLYTAERYRLQKLTPDEFEKYLSYAIVFKIEKEWAEKFKDIYNKVPDWYEGSTSDALWNAYWVSTFARSFSDSTAAHMTPVSSGSSGGGWSGGGGSFGGFSGGGGGGGSSGGW